jgi:hypothetical protein
MKHLTIFLVSLAFAATANAQAPATAACDIQVLTDSCKARLKPFHYNAINTLHVNLKSIQQTPEINLPAMPGMIYRVIVNISAMPQGTEVSIYNIPKGAKKRSALYTYNTDSLKNSHVGFFDFTEDANRYGRIFIDYTIPEANPKICATGCAVILSGWETGGEEQ